MNNQEEYRLQKSCFQWMCLKPKLLPFFWSIDHGELRNLRVAMKLKAKGVKGGIADCLFLKKYKDHPCLWIELKVKNRKLSPNQKIFFNQTKACGMKSVVCRTLEGFIDEINNYIKTIECLLEQ